MQFAFTSSLNISYVDVFTTTCFVCFFFYVKRLCSKHKKQKLRQVAYRLRAHIEAFQPQFPFQGRVSVHLLKVYHIFLFIHWFHVISLPPSHNSHRFAGYKSYVTVGLGLY